MDWYLESRTNKRCSEQVMIAILPSKNSSYFVENIDNSLLLAAIFASYLKFFNGNLINQTYSDIPKDTFNALTDQLSDHVWQ